METQEKKAVMKVVEILGQLSRAWSHLPDDVQESTVGDLQVLGIHSIRDLAGRLESMTNGYTGNCEHCGKLFKSKGKGSKQRFCSTSCRVMANREKKYNDYEAKKAAETW